MFLILLPHSSNADCGTVLKEFSSYQNQEGGRVVIYIVPAVYVIKASDLACVILREFFINVNNVEDKLITGVTTADFRQLFLAKWGLKDNYFTFIDINIKSKDHTGLGAFVTYAKPLSIIEDIAAGREISSPSKLSNTVSASVPQIKSIVYGN